MGFGGWRWAVAARVVVATSLLVVATATVASAGEDDPVGGQPRAGGVSVSEPVVDGAGVRGRGLQPAAGAPHLDPTWSGDGIAGLTGNRYMVSLSPQDSGRLYTASFNEADGGPMRLTRFEANGSLSTSFGGGDGVLQRGFAPGDQHHQLPV